MRFQTLFAVSALLAVPALGHGGPGDDDDDAPAPVLPKVIADSTSAPAGCKLKDTDKGFPAPSVWKTISPNIKTKEGPTRPDYHLSVKTLEEVQNAVKFAAKYNIRLTMVNSGHDFLGRNDAPTGLSLDVSGLQGPIVVSKTFVASTTPNLQIIGKAAPAASSGDEPSAASSDTSSGSDMGDMSGMGGSSSSPGLSDSDASSDATLADNSSDAGSSAATSSGSDMGDMDMGSSAATSSGSDMDMGSSDDLTASSGTGGSDSTAKSAASQAAMAKLMAWLAKLYGNGANSMFKPLGGATKLGKRAFEAPAAASYVTFGVGMSTQDLNDALDSHGLFTMGAAHGEVTVAGGYGQTGGHGPFTNTYGLAVDQWKEFKLVTPDGKLVVANAQVNPDLFWALRGGGGSTWGVVLEATAKAFTTTNIIQGAFALNITTSGVAPASYWDMNAELHRQLPALSAQGVSGYYYIYPYTTTVMLMIQGPDATVAKLKTTIAPFLAATSKFAGIKLTTPTYTSYKSYKAWFDHEFPMDDMMKRRRSLNKRDPVDGVAEPNGLTQLDSRILGARHFKSPTLAAALKAAMPSGPLGQLRGNFVSGLGVSALASTSETSVNPAWRSGLTHLIASGIPGAWNVDSLRTLATDSGAYANEASWNQTSWKTAFWGENYSKLSAIKTKYDPNNVFWASPGINADHLVVTDGRLCSVTGAAGTNALAMTAADRNNMPPANDNTNQNTDPENDEGTTIIALMPWSDVIANILPSSDDD